MQKKFFFLSSKNSIGKKNSIFDYGPVVIRRFRTFHRVRKDRIETLWGRDRIERLKGCDMAEREVIRVRQVGQEISVLKSEFDECREEESHGKKESQSLYLLHSFHPYRIWV